MVVNTHIIFHQCFLILTLTKANFEMVVPLQKQNILKNDNIIFKDISKINLAITYLSKMITKKP